VNIYSENTGSFNPKEKVLNELKELKMKNLVSLRSSGDDIGTVEPDPGTPMTTPREDEPETDT